MAAKENSHTFKKKTQKPVKIIFILLKPRALTTLTSHSANTGLNARSLYIMFDHSLSLGHF